MEWLSVDFVRQLIEDDGMSLRAASDYLQICYPSEDGLSCSNISRFCVKHGIRSEDEAVSDDKLDEEVEKAVSQVGSSYGRRLMTAHLRSKGTTASERRVAKSLQKVQPSYHENRRRGTQKQLNPVPYYTPYFGYNLHMDQNEKLVDFGLVFVLAIDGCSGFIPSFAVMPKKNNISIYRDVFRPAVRSYGLWDQVVVDHGREFYLTLFMQEYMRQSVTSQRPAYKQNNRIERMWVEINQRIGYPLKYALLDLENTSTISKEDPFQLYVMNQVAKPVAEQGISTFVSSWNMHSVPGRGAPSSFIPELKKIPTDALLLPWENAKELYESQCGNRLTDETSAGIDLLADDRETAERRDGLFREKVVETVGNANDIFGATANHNYQPLHKAIRLFIDLTTEFH